MNRRYAFLSRLRNYGVSAALAFVVWYLVKRRSLNNKLVDVNKKSVQYNSVPVASTTTNALFYKLIGHAAELKPWIFRDIGILAYDMFERRTHWYQTVSEKPEETSNNVLVKMVRHNFLFTKDVDLISAMIGKEDKLFRNSDTIRNAWGTLFPKSVTIMTGDSWKRVRRVLISAVHKLDLEQLPRSTNAVLERGLPNLMNVDEKEINLWDFFSRLTFDSFTKFTFRTEFDTMSGKDMWLLNMLRKLTRKVCDRMAIDFPWLWYLPFGDTPALFKLRDQLVSFIDNDVMKDRQLLYKKDPVKFRETACKSLVDAMILASVETQSDKKQISHEEVRSQLVAAMFGGFDTTTSSLSFLYLALCGSPEYQDILYNEVKDIDLKKISKAELDNLPYLNAIIKESQRLHAVAGLVVRVPNEDVVIKDTFIAKDTMVMIDNERIAHQPKHWNNATDLSEFKPERWFNFTPAPGVFSPFGFGGRKCPGYRIAHVQLQTILCYLTQNYRFEFANNPIKKRCSLGLTVSDDSSLIIKKRL